MTESLKKQSIEGFLTDLASPQPTPGGGAAAALTFAQAAALLAMVCRISNKAEERLLQDTAHQACVAMEKGLQHGDLDAKAFEKLMQVLKMPKTCPATQEVRKREVEAASLAAAQVPLDTIRMARDLLGQTQSISSYVSRHLQSDLGVIAALLQAAVSACRLTVLINLQKLSSVAKAQAMLKELQTLTDEVGQQSNALQKSVEAVLQ